jgi:hypothetical protein
VARVAVVYVEVLPYTARAFVRSKCYTAKVYRVAGRLRSTIITRAAVNTVIISARGVTRAAVPTRVTLGLPVTRTLSALVVIILTIVILINLLGGVSERLLFLTGCKVTVEL